MNYLASASQIANCADYAAARGVSFDDAAYSFFVPFPPLYLGSRFKKPSLFSFKYRRPFLSNSALHEFITASRLDLERDESFLQFQLRDEPCPHFCGWCGLNAHAKGECTHGN